VLRERPLDLLAYVFWHWPRTEVQREQYERALVEFYKALRIVKPQGFVDCFGHRLDTFPWKAPVSNGYEDWYLIEDFQSLGILNETAVSGKMKEPHHAIASLAAGGSGGMYRLKGIRYNEQVQFSTWFPKPAGMSYHDLNSILNTLDHSYHWQRQLTLGPAPEFCVHSNERIVLPIKFAPTTIGIQKV
jgi:hypothetical protein